MEFDTGNKEKSGAHSDVSKNLTYYKMLINGTEFAKDDICIEIMDKFEPLCITISWGPGPTDSRASRRKGAFVVSFHQEHRLFSEEIYNVINNLIGKGLARLKPKNQTKKWND